MNTKGIYSNSKLFKLIGLIVLLCVTMLSPLHTIHADEDEDDPMDPTVLARVTFTNAPNHQPDLYVAKKVICNESDIAIPDEEFTFQILIDGDAYAGETYYLVDSSNNPILDDMKNPISGKTTASGTFSLKDKQVARFDYVGAEKTYEVKEIGILENFECISPSSSVSSGTVGKDGSQVNFTNLYTPPVPPESSKGTLDVMKIVSWPDHYKYTDDSTTPLTFSFELKVNGSPVANKTFDLYNTETGITTSNYDKTDANGVFSIGKDCIAKFNDLEGNADYKVKELDKEGWRLVGENDREGSTSANKTEVFSNAISSFIVSKTLMSGTTSQEFTFTLFGTGKTVMPNAKYWKYKTDGTRVYTLNEEGQKVYTTYKTDTKGQFTLKQNEVAIFIGIAPGTVYSVQEELVDGFKQVYPLSSLGYENKTVTSTGDELLQFVNEIKEEKASLSVTKKLSYTDDAPLVSKSFRFRLEVKDGESFKPLSEAVYTIGSDTTNYATDKNGEFTLRQNETAHFNKLILNKDYRVKEIIDSSSYPGYTLVVSEELSKDSDGYYYYEGRLEDESALSFVFTNKYDAKTAKLQITKVNSSDDSIGLPDAKFTLWLDEKCTKPYSSDVYTTGSDGTATITGLKAGTYYLKEESAPAGYKVLPQIVKIDIERVYDSYGIEGFKMSITCDEAIIGKVSADISESFKISPLLSLTVKDDDARIVKLPNTGGPGIYLYLIVGSALLTYGLLEKRR